jgi:hypothetical protein
MITRFFFGSTAKVAFMRATLAATPPRGFLRNHGSAPLIGTNGGFSGFAYRERRMNVAKNAETAWHSNILTSRPPSSATNGAWPAPRN